MDQTHDIQKMMNQLDAKMKDQIGIDTILIEAGALTKLPAYLEQREAERVQVVVDTYTYEAAGKLIEDILEKSKVQVKVNTTFIQPNAIGDVIADEASIVQLLLHIQQFKPQIVIAVGGGTLHDIVRYAAYTTSLPFLSVPTAPSVDGFTSKGAPIIVRGYKKTIISIGPDAIFADLDVLTRSPKSMVAAGFGDILGKYTSLFDWKFGALTNHEPYLEESEMITQKALFKCVDQASLIAKRDEEGIATLISALIESGIAMLVFGKSHPASGSEHHLSHFWEMEYIAQGRKQLLHGAKVGVACIQISKLYHGLVKEQFGIQANVRESVSSHWAQIVKWIDRIPGESELKELLFMVEGPVTIEQLGVSEDLLGRSLQGAHHIRPERYTLLHARNESLL
jgi:glycerol-1-phosphate dehydrogenase [NAD(P)+]